MCQSFRSLFICLITWLYPDCLLHHLNFHFINAGEKKNPSRICSRSPHALLAHIPSTDGASVSLNRKSWYLRLISPGWVFDFPSTVFCPNLFSYRVLRYSQLFLSLNSLDFAKWQFLPLPRPPPPIPSFLKADELIRSKSCEKSFKITWKEASGAKALSFFSSTLLMEEQLLYHTCSGSVVHYDHIWSP